LLLTKVRGPSSFDDLKTVNGVKYRTYKEAAVKRGFAMDDSEWYDCLKEASATSHPRDLRTLFALILIHNEPSDPMKLWNEFKDKLSDDIRHKKKCSQNQAELEAYSLMALKLNIHAIRGHNFDYFVKKYQMPKVNVGFEENEPLSRQQCNILIDKTKIMF